MFPSWEKELSSTVFANDLDTFKSKLSHRSEKDLSKPEWLDGEDPMHLAALCGRRRMVRLLLSSGADIDSVVVNGNDRCAALHCAVGANQPAMVRLLLDRGADWKMHGVWGARRGTPLQMARDHGYDGVVKILEEHQINEEQKAAEARIKKEAREKELLEAAQRMQLRTEKTRRRIAKLDQVILEYETQLTALREKRSILASKLEKEMSKAETEEERGCCPICFEMAGQVFSCRRCENWVCGSCKDKQLLNCPSCRADFRKKPPKRNKGIERALGI